MKVGIVTMPLTINYGAVLQNFALQKVLRFLGHEPITLDFMPVFYKRTYLLRVCHQFACLLKSGKMDIHELNPFTHRHHQPISDFIKQHISTTETFWHHYSHKIIDRYKLDAIVVGSDQVWRPRYNTRIEDMYLKFAKDSDILRVAYAASFGTANWEYTNPSLAQKCGKLLEKFKAISVREASGIELAAKLGRNDAVNVLDPTLLLGKEGFLEIVTPFKNKPDGNYIGAYILDKNDDTTERLNSISAKLGINQVLVLQEAHDLLGPGEWIDAIASSSVFITDSYHGTVFAILNHVPFITKVNITRGADRFYSLLKPLNLEFAMIHDIQELTPERVSSLSFDWDKIDTRLDELRKKSMEFLTCLQQ